MKRINLFLLADVQYGGFITYTYHLKRSLELAGYEVPLFKVGKRTETQMRQMSHGLRYQNVSQDAALYQCAKYPTVITAAYADKKPELLSAMLSKGARLVLHDPTEMHDSILQTVRKTKVPVITIRKNSPKVFEEIYNLYPPAVFVPHPYVPTFIARGAKEHKKTVRAVTLSRLDFDKHTDIIVEANTMLPADKKIQIWGAPNGMYVFHKIAKRWPKWDKDYKGAFPKTDIAALNIVNDAHYMVDMSLIKNDGGGTQYTTLEAWNMCAVPIIQRGWLQPGGEMQHGVNCWAVEDAHQLAAVVQKTTPKPSLIKACQEQMWKHSWEKIVPKFIEAARW